MGTVIFPKAITRELFKKSTGYLPNKEELALCNDEGGWDYMRNLPVWVSRNDGRIPVSIQGTQIFPPVYSDQMKNCIFVVSWTGPYSVIPNFGLLPVVNPNTIGVIWEFPVVQEVGDRIGKVIDVVIFDGNALPMGPELYARIVTVIKEELSRMVKNRELMKNPWTQLWETRGG